MQVNIKPKSDPRSDRTSPKKLRGPKWIKNGPDGPETRLPVYPG